MEQSAPYRIFFGNNVRGLTVFFLNSSFAGIEAMGIGASIQLLHLEGQWM